MLSFVLFHAVIFVGGTWLAIGPATGYWDPAYLLCIPLLLLHFSIFFGFSVLLAVWTRQRRGLRVRLDRVLVRCLEHELRPARPGHVHRPAGREHAVVAT